MKKKFVVGIVLFVSAMALVVSFISGSATRKQVREIRILMKFMEESCQRGELTITDATNQLTQAGFVLSVEKKTYPRYPNGINRYVFDSGWLREFPFVPFTSFRFTGSFYEGEEDMVVDFGYVVSGDFLP